MRKMVIVLIAVLAGIALAQTTAGEESLFREVILPSLLSALVAVAGGFVTWASTAARAYFLRRAEATKSEMLRGILVMVADQAGIAVQHLAQRAVDNLRAASVDGRLSPEDGAAALKAAVLETWASLGEQARQLLLDQFGTADAAMHRVIEPAVEAKVREAKVTTPISKPPVANPAQAEVELQLARQRLAAMTGA